MPWIRGSLVSSGVIARLVALIVLLAMAQVGPARDIEALEAALVIGLAVVLGIFAVGSP